MVETIRKVPGVDPRRVAEDNPELEWLVTYKVDNSKARRELGIEFTSLEEIYSGYRVADDALGEVASEWASRNEKD